MKPWMMCEGEYQSDRCWEFSLDAVPELHIAAFADGLAAHGEQDGRLQRDEADDGDDDLVAAELHERIYAEIRPPVIHQLLEFTWIDGFSRTVANVKNDKFIIQVGIEDPVRVNPKRN